MLRASACMRRLECTGLTRRNGCRVPGHEVNFVACFPGNPSIVFLCYSFLRSIPKSVFVVVVPDAHNLESDFWRIFSYFVDIHRPSMRKVPKGWILLLLLGRFIFLRHRLLPLCKLSLGYILRQLEPVLYRLTLPVLTYLDARF